MFTLRQQKIRITKGKRKRILLLLFFTAVILGLTGSKLLLMNRITTHSTSTLKNHNQNPHAEKITIKAGDGFVPGSLNLTRFETYQRCYVDPIRYINHLEADKRRPYRSVEVSVEHNLLYAVIEKVGSSRIRTTMDSVFNAEYKPCNRINFTIDSASSWHHFTFTRDPMSRFRSSFQEVMHRWISWKLRKEPPQEVQEFVQLYKDTNITKDHDGMIHALETFVMEQYNGYTVPNTHLRLQIASIVPRPERKQEGECPPLNAIYELGDLQEVFTNMVAKHNINSTISGQIRYGSTLNLNMSKVSTAVKRKICQLSALDYCCLNYQLPPECEGALSCQWKENLQLPSNSSSTSSHLLIEALSPYPS